ncbi:MAG: DUF1492 domain-containing protein [Oscillospiraceae bacterium]
MTAKEFLRPLKTVQTEIETLRDQLRTIHESLTAITPMYGERIGSSGSHNVHSMSDRICEAIDTEHELTEAIEKQIAVQSYIISAINEIPDIECRAVLHWRYVKQLSWNEVADKIHLTEPGVYKKHRIALNQLEKTKKFKNWAVQYS